MAFLNIGSLVSVPVEIDDELERLLCRQLLLCADALDALAHNPTAYPPVVILHRVEEAKKALRLSAEGRKMLEEVEL